MAALNDDLFEYAEFQVDEQDPNQHVDWKLLPMRQAYRVWAGEGTMYLGSMHDGLYKYHLTPCVAPFIADHGLVWKPTNGSRPWAPRCARTRSIAMSGRSVDRSQMVCSLGQSSAGAGSLPWPRSDRAWP